MITGSGLSTLSNPPPASEGLLALPLVDVEADCCWQATSEIAANSWSRHFARIRFTSANRRPDYPPFRAPVRETRRQSQPTRRTRVQSPRFQDGLRPWRPPTRGSHPRAVRSHLFWDRAGGGPVHRPRVHLLGGARHPHLAGHRGPGAPPRDRLRLHRLHSSLLPLPDTP